MPRDEDKKQRWVKEVGFDEFYNIEDPWNIKGDREEIRKVNDITSLMHGGYSNCMDIGCGEGYTSMMYYDYCNSIIGYDISKNAIDRANTLYGDKMTFIEGDIRDGFSKDLKGKFDLVLCNEVLYYIEPQFYSKVAENIYSLLSTNGQLIISAGHYFTQIDFETIFDKMQFSDVIQIPSKGNTYSLIMSGTKK